MVFFNLWQYFHKHLVIFLENIDYLASESVKVLHRCRLSNQVKTSEQKVRYEDHFSFN